MPALRVQENARIAVRDYRHLAGRPASERVVLLRALVDGSKAPTVVWGEALAPAGEAVGVACQDRRSLRPAKTLIVWTAPPSVEQWEKALATVAPQEVVLVCLDPGMDAPRAFLQRLAALIKYTLREYRGRTGLPELAAATAQTDRAVRLGLQWLAARGQIALDVEGGRVRLRPAGAGARAKGRDRIEGSLLAELQESAAFRAYLRVANADRLVNQSLKESK
jgi:hypothetical protein